jgi:Tfp pilus assembly protein PilN
MNQPAEDALIAKIRELPAERIAQVEDFVNFLAMQERRREAAVRLQALRDRLPPEEITDPEMQEIVEAVKEVRAARRAERNSARRT